MRIQNVCPSATLLHPPFVSLSMQSHAQFAITLDEALYVYMYRRDWYFICFTSCLKRSRWFSQNHKDSLFRHAHATQTHTRRITGFAHLTGRSVVRRITLNNLKNDHTELATSSSMMARCEFDEIGRAVLWQSAFLLFLSRARARASQLSVDYLK